MSVFVQNKVLREETIECINTYINETFVYVLETEPHRGCISICVIKFIETYVLETGLYSDCIKHLRS